jgi:hypothetical protein
LASKSSAKTRVFNIKNEGTEISSDRRPNISLPHSLLDPAGLGAPFFVDWIPLVGELARVTIFIVLERIVRCSMIYIHMQQGDSSVRVLRFTAKLFATAE